MFGFLVLLVVCAVVAAAGCSNGDGPLRVCFNLTYVVNHDSGTCYAAGQVVQLCSTTGECVDYPCTAADVVDLTVLQNCLPLAAASASKLYLDHLCVPGQQTSGTFENCLRSTETFNVPCDHVVTITMRPATSGIIAGAGSDAGEPASTFTCRFTDHARPSAAWMNIAPQVVNPQLTARGATAASVTEPSSTRGVTAGVEVFRALLLHYSTHTLGIDITQLYAWSPPGGGASSYLTFNATQYPYGPLFPMDAASEEIMYRTGEAAAYGFFNGSLVSATRRVMLVTPTLVQVAREYFDCPTLRGVLLEELIPSGILFERRLLPFEANTAPFGVPDRAAWSIFSIALLVDTGFYTLGDGVQLRAGKAGDPYFVGHKAGCAYTHACSPSASPTWAAMLCNGTFGIGYDATFASLCGNAVMPAARWVPPYQHVPSNLTLGGWDAYGDYCPYAGNTTNGDGSGSVVVASCLSAEAYERRATQGNAVDTQYSSRVGPGTRAVFSTLLNLSFSLPNRNLFDNIPRCAAILCLNESLMLFRGGDSWYPCVGDFPAVSELMYPFAASLPPDHAPINPSIAQTSYFFYGQIQCPNPALVCKLVPTNTDGTKNADMYGAGGYLNPSTYPVLYNVTPARGSVLGGTVLTVLGLNMFTPNSQVLTDCRGLLIGGQMTNHSTFVRGQSAYVDGVLLQSFLVVTSPIDLTKPILGGTAGDGSGVVDVELLCRIPNAMQCGPAFDGYCGVDRQRAAFVLEPAPLAAGSLGFIATTAGTAMVAALGTLALVLMLVAATLFNRQQQPTEASGAKDVDGEEMSTRAGGTVDAALSDSGGSASLSVSLLKVDDTAVVTLNGLGAPTATSAAAAAPSTFAAPADLSSDVPPQPRSVVAAAGPEAQVATTTATAGSASPQEETGLVITLDSDDDPPPPPPPPAVDDDDDIPPPPPPPPPSSLKAASSTLSTSKKQSSMTAPPSRRSSAATSSRKMKSGRGARSGGSQHLSMNDNEDDDEPPPPPPVEL